MKFGSICAGIGGGCLGFEAAGFECAWQIEIDPFCISVLEKHWPNVTRYQDVKATDASVLERVDLILATIPCQPHSLAGKRRGAEDPRDLWPDTRRIVADLRPSWFVLENPIGIRGTILPRVRADLEELGYEVADVELPACAVAAPHGRSRVFVVAHSGRFDLQRRSEHRSISRAQGTREGEELQRQRRRDTTSNGGACMADGDCRRREVGGIAQSPRLESEGGSLADRCGEVRQLDHPEAGVVNAARIEERDADVQANARADASRARSVSPSRGDRGFWDDAVWIECNDNGKRCLRRAKPALRALDDGIPGGLVRLEDVEPLTIPHFKGRREQLMTLGNALVPQLAELIGRYIMEAERE